MDNVEILVVGAGAAGLQCARSAYESGARSVLLADSSKRVGGILPQCLHTGFGISLFGQSLTGPEFLSRLLKGFAPGVEQSLQTMVTDLAADRTARLVSPCGIRTVSFRRLVLACGCRERSIYSLPVSGTRPAGVFTAGLAQQLVNLDGVDIGDNIVILGSGDIGLVMAGRFAELGKKVVAVVEQKPSLGGLLRNQQRFIRANNIPVITLSTVDELHGGERICGVTVRHLDSGAREYLPCGTLVTALGLIPDRSLLDGISEDGSLPSWVSLAGNCSFVHDIVDRVVREADALGKQIAGELAPSPGSRQDAYSC